MRWIFVFLSLLFVTVVAFAAYTFAFFDDIQPQIAQYGALASVIGLLVSVVGFGFTLWTVLETRQIDAKAQVEIREKVEQSQDQTERLLANIRDKSLSDTCDYAFYCASEARTAVRTKSWLRAAEKSQDARQSTMRLLSYPNLRRAERTQFLGIAEDLKTLISFIERNRLKPDAPDGLPTEKLAPLDSLIDELEQLRSRLLQQFMEIPNGND